MRCRLGFPSFALERIENFAHAHVKLDLPDYYRSIWDAGGELVDVPVCNVFPPVIQVVTHTAEIFAGWFCMAAEINQSLKDLRTAIAFFLVTGE